MNGQREALRCLRAENQARATGKDPVRKGFHFRVHNIGQLDPFPLPIISRRCSEPSRLRTADSTWSTVFFPTNPGNHGLANCEQV